MEGGLGEPGRGGRVVQGRGGGGIRGRRLAVDGDLVDWSVVGCRRVAGGGGASRHNVSRHVDGCRVWREEGRVSKERKGWKWGGGGGGESWEKCKLRK